MPQLKDFDHARFDALRAIYKNFSEADAQRIKEIESVTNHDVKAVEYFIKEEFDKLGGMEAVSYTHLVIQMGSRSECPL